MNKTSGAKLITCILKKGRAIPLMEALSEKGLLKINFAFARGSDLNDSVDSKGRLKESEKEIVTVVVDDPNKAEETFDFIFEKAKINEPGEGLIYMSCLGYSTSYSLEKY